MECKFDERKCNSNQKWNNDRFLIKKNIYIYIYIYVKKNVFGILLHVVAKMENSIIIDNSVSTSNETIDKQKQFLQI